MKTCLDTTNNTKEYILYTMCDDSRLSTLATFLESNSNHDNAKVKVIPFNDNIDMVKRLCMIYNADIVQIDNKWDVLGQALFNDEEYRPGIKSWRYFRKFNVFNSKNEKIIFLDSNVVILNNLVELIGMLRIKDILFAARSHVGRNFHPWSKTILNMLDNNLRDGFNAGFFCTNSNLFHDINFKFLSTQANIRKMLTVSPEQSFLSMLIVLKKRRFDLISNIDSTLHAMLASEKIDLTKEIFQKNKILTIKWTGAYFVENKKMPNSNFLKNLILKVDQKTRKDKILNKYLLSLYAIYV